MSFDLTNKNISDTFQNLLQKTGSDGHLYDLQGNKVRNLKIDGTLTANSYVTTQSVTLVTSGSNIFGNSSDDTHHFTGSTYVSGNIHIPHNNALSISPSNLGTSMEFEEGRIKFVLNTAELVRFKSSGGGTTGVSIGSGGAVATDPAINGLTVEGGISASGDFVLGSTISGQAYLSASAGNLTMSGSGTGLLQVDGDISSSGTTVYSKNTIANDDDSPDVSSGTYFETGTNTDTITTFDNGKAGQIIYVISKAAITYDYNANNLKCGTADLVTAANDLTTWLFDGTNWILVSYTDQSDNLS